MKVKLLKKIRNQYSIIYYPKGFLDYRGRPICIGMYEIRKNDYFYDYVAPSKEEALEYILEKVRRKYSKYSRKNKKENYSGIKVWYNK